MQQMVLPQGSTRLFERSCSHRFFVILISFPAKAAAILRLRCRVIQHQFLQAVFLHRMKKKSQQPEKPTTGVISGGDGGIRTHGPLRIKRFRVFYSEHTLADFEKKCPILREKALVRRKWLLSPFWLFPTVRNARELSERTDRTAIKHNNRKSP